MAEKTSFKTISENRQVRHEYFVEETYEAGIELYGTEVKSLRAGTVNMQDSWCSIEATSSTGTRFGYGVC